MEGLDDVLSWAILVFDLSGDLIWEDEHCVDLILVGIWFWDWFCEILGLILGDWLWVISGTDFVKLFEDSETDLGLILEKKKMILGEKFC